VYAIYVAVSIEGLSGFYTELMRGVAAGSRLFELAERVPAIPIDGIVFIVVHTRVTLQHKTFI
jgi:ATP-binding cassette subfamily B (MDR/TAP) protein 10